MNWRFVLAWWIVLSALISAFIFATVLILSHETFRLFFFLGVGAIVVFWSISWALDYLQSYRGSR